MKTIFLTLMMGAQLSWASVIEYNHEEQKIYMHPTPVLEMSLIDLGSDGGVLNVSLEYRSENSKNEIQQLKDQFPQYEVQVLTAERLENVNLEINDIYLNQELSLRQGAMGPYINAQISLKSYQVSRLKNQGNKILERISLKLPAKVAYMSEKVIEQISESPQICERLKVRSVQDLLMSLGELKASSAVQYQETVKSLKNDILKKCFSVNETQIHSFKELMESQITTLRPNDELVGKTLKRTEVSRRILIVPQIQLELN